MQLSIIIVNYNVKYFLEHCILSVQQACKNILAEIIVVDNASQDDSVQMLLQKYPTVITIANTINNGFAKANNQAVKIAKGENILFLNPDTIVAEDCFEKCLEYLKNNLQVGALGVRLIDGKGVFLPESKRGFPSFETAFYKISGLSTIFKKSTVFNKYHLGYLPQHQTNEVDVLAGCFMMIPKNVLEITGSFSEDYFMYGEDIDLSYCVQKVGFKNIYFADTTVIHYKGESTKKGSLNYVKMFYNAMIIFARKHLAPNKAKTFIPLIKIAISVRALLSIANRFLKLIWLPILDAIIIIICLWQTKLYWINNIKTETSYNANIVNLFFTIYTITWIGSLFLNGAYDKPLKKLNILRGMLMGLLVTLSIYGLLPETIRFSRGITLIGAAISTLVIWSSRFLLQKIGVRAVQPENVKGKSIITVANNQELNEVILLLKSAGIDKDIIGNIAYQNKNNNDLGTIDNIVSIAKTYQIGEIIFTFQTLSFKKIIELIEQLGTTYNYKIHAQGTDSIIGSNSKNTAGDLYAEDWYFNIAKANGIRNKRLFDMISAFLIIILSPILIWFLKPKQILQNAINVLIGKNTWIGYCQNANEKKLPKIKKSILPLNINVADTTMNTDLLNLHYARYYSIVEDRKVLWRYLWKK